MSRTKKAFALRVSPDLYAALERWAADELRSVNGQIEYLLTDAARRAGRLPDPDGNVKEARRAPGDDAD
ncbi:hypothetical protein [Deinococcus pimensis]|uniref:hypothetical protein n=1 Tax=Deinococcus pimensis TaxID=309888 RepID=UPI0004878922|nr:hypothetical protein [Deinococcus pimensis]